MTPPLTTNPSRIPAARLAGVERGLPTAPATGPWPTETFLFTQLPLLEAEAIVDAAIVPMAEGRAPGHRILLAEHPPTWIAGADADPALAARLEAACADAGFDFIRSTRRGGVSYFGPGMLTGHMAFALDHWRREPDALVAAIERIALRTLEALGVHGALRDAGGRALSVGGRVVAAVETRVTRWIARVRFTIHVNTDIERALPPGIDLPLARRIVPLTRLGVAVERHDEVRGWLLKHYEEELGSRPLIPPRETGAKPPWLRAKLPSAASTEGVRAIIEGGKLNTVCESARCPNLGECWSHGTATFMINGNVCTRSCSFCAIFTGRPKPLDPDEPRRVAEAARAMGLAHVVVTAVNRDELEDGGASQFVAALAALREALPEARVEVLIPDFRGNEGALEEVFAARPDVLNHNVETVPRLYPRVRPQARYRQSLDVITAAKRAGLATKSGLMLGLGEEPEEVEALLHDLREAGCEIVTIGQYLRPSEWHHPVVRYVTPSEFEQWGSFGRSLGFKAVESGALVRSSYHARESFGRAGNAAGAAV